VSFQHKYWKWKHSVGIHTIPEEMEVSGRGGFWSRRAQSTVWPARSPDEQHGAGSFIFSKGRGRRYPQLIGTMDVLRSAFCLMGFMVVETNLLKEVEAYV
jgi:hypothetical protein